MTLRVGVPTETKVDEFRVALTPEGVRELGMHGIEVLVQAGAGAGSGLTDDAYRRAGAEIVDAPAEVWERAQVVCKVKEPLEHEFAYFRDDLVLFTFLHLAVPELTLVGDVSERRFAARDALLTSLDERLQTRPGADAASQMTKFQLAPCHRPQRRNTVHRLKYVLRGDPRLPPIGI